MSLRAHAIAVLLLAAPAAAQERPTIVVGSPEFRPLPLAVVEFGGDAEARRAAAEATALVRADLTLSGLFDVLDPKGFLADPTEGYAPTAIKFARWADVGADGLVKARLARTATDLAGELHLYDVRGGREVLAKTIHVAASEPRRLAHRIADEIVRYYTHEPGVFATQIAAVRKRPGAYELVLLDVDGGSPRVLLSERRALMAPTWRPDGRELLVTSYRTGRPEIWAYRLADRSFRQLGGIPNSMGGVYSPDGSRIAFSVTKDGNTHLWVMNADGGGARQLTHERCIDVTPTWSPDGRQIAFSSDRAGSSQLYVIGADGGNLRRLTFQGNYNQTPQWSPRGDQIAFTARDERLVFDVFAISPATGTITRLTQDQGRTNEEPSWAPNGRLLVFRTDRGGIWQLVVSDAHGDRQTVIAGARGTELAGAAWGPAQE
ncbi:protein TolB [Anaeromyxobacter oryzisoli]|uniref:protein TolB n=1 Tax=Anaeromyxobacter oryzisoli TaxID=2925408 RepID=UPI001F598A49|nr:protein TolB [Anaeromyxobacter sp. SG63]